MSVGGGEGGVGSGRVVEDIVVLSFEGGEVKSVAGGAR